MITIAVPQAPADRAPRLAARREADAPQLAARRELRAAEVTAAAAAPRPALCRARNLSYHDRRAALAAAAAAGNDSEASMLPPSPAPRAAAAAAARAVPKKKAVAPPPSDEDVPIATMTGRAAKLPEARVRAPKRRVVDDTEETPAPATPSKLSRRNA